jgi:hypothetical protein
MQVVFDMTQWRHVPSRRRLRPFVIPSSPSFLTFSPRSLDTASPCAPARLGQMALDPVLSPTACGHNWCACVPKLFTVAAACACDAALPHGTKKLAILSAGVQSRHCVAHLHALPNRLPRAKPRRQQSQLRLILYPIDYEFR